MEEAKASQHEESYRILTRGEGFLVSVGARSKGKEGDYFVEVTVQLCAAGPEVDLRSMERALSMLKALHLKGYSMTCAEGSVTCELSLSEGDLSRECERLKSELGRVE